MQELFASPSFPWQPDLPDAELHYYPHFWSRKEADALFEQLKNETPWQHDPITVFGKTYMQPRLTALYGKNPKPYSYSGITMNPHPMSITLMEVLQKIQTVDPHAYNTVLLNLYRNGKDSNGWHADNEKELGPHPRIASASFGEERFFSFQTSKRQATTVQITFGIMGAC